MALNLLFLEGTAGRSLFELAGEALAAACGTEVNFVRAPALPVSAMAEAPQLSGSWDLVLLSLTAELELAAPHPAPEAALAGLIASLQARGAAVALATLFRHVPRGHPSRAALQSRLRALNAAVFKLSHQQGCFVLDLDRELSHSGALELQADCFGGGEAASEVATSELMVLALEMLGDRLAGAVA